MGVTNNSSCLLWVCYTSWKAVFNLLENEMKLQCNSAADCLRELARVMDQFGIADAVEAAKSKYAKTSNLYWHLHTLPPFASPETWKFAIAEVEGKPVFFGDKLYDWKGDAHTAPYLNDGAKMDLRKGCDWSWTPPKPKTVMVEMLLVDAKSLISAESLRLFDIASLNTRVRESCKKAVEELK